MKFALASDLHLEFKGIELKNTEDADVLILAGDICVASHFDQGKAVVTFYRQFFEQVSSEFREVIYIMGNHEHYHGDFAKTPHTLAKELVNIPNVRFLQKNSIDIKGVRFIGDTLWTDMNKRNPQTMQIVGNYMNDFVCVKNSDNPVSYRVPNMYESMSFKTRPGTFSTEDAANDHDEFLAYIDALCLIDNTMPVVVVGHHLPSFMSVPKEYAKMFHQNCGYASDLSEFILDRPAIKYWIHGHTHDEMDYMIGDTRIVCNPRGYAGHEAQANKFRLKFYDVK